MFGPDDAFLTTILKLLGRLPIYPMFGRGLTRLQPAYVEDVAEAIARTLQGTETHPITFECGGPRVYSYEEFLRAVAHEAGLKPILIPIPFAIWHALVWFAEMLPSPPVTRNQVELMQVDNVSSPEMPGFGELGILPRSVEEMLQEIYGITDQRASSASALQNGAGRGTPIPNPRSPAGDQRAEPPRAPLRRTSVSGSSISSG
jgi:NADH dehydrogenase